MTHYAIVAVGDLPTRQRVCRELRAADLEVCEARTPEHVLALASERLPQLVVFQFGPGHEAAELCGRLRTLPGAQHVAILAITERADPPLIEAALAAGATDWLSLPISPVHLCYRLRFLLRSSCRPPTAHRASGAPAQEPAGRVTPPGSEAGYWECEPRSGEVRLSPRALAILQLSAEPETLASLADLAVHPEERTKFLLAIEAAAAGDPRDAIEHRGRPAPRLVRHSLLAGSQLPGDSDRLTFVVADIGEERAQADRLKRVALYDPVTGLPSRALFDTRIDSAIARFRGSDNCIAVMLIEATGLDGVRDRLGPLVCDEALRVLARRLVHSVRESDTISRVEGVQGGVARVGANELAILLTGIERLEDVTACARRLADRVQEPVPVLGQHLEVGAVMGIAMFPRDGSTASDLLGSARRAREDAKVGAEGSSHRFSAHRAINDEERALVIMSELPHVAQRGELQVLYQPRVELPSQRIIGAEALLRWQHPRLGEISPREFIEIAEREGSIEAIGTWVLAKACAEAARWGELRVSVNVSRSQLQSAGFANRVFQALIQARLRPDQLELEITESLMLEGESCLDPLRELDAVGVSLALDDFGSGYSSLSALVRFPIKVLKLDRSIVQQIDSNPHAARVLRGVVSLGQDLGMRVVAEGVDRAEQVALLLEAGCAEAQGFHFSRPIPARDFAALAAAARTTTP